MQQSSSRDEALTSMCLRRWMMEPSLTRLMKAQPAPLSVMVRPRASSVLWISTSLGRPARKALLRRSLKGSSGTPMKCEKQSDPTRAELDIRTAQCRQPSRSALSYVPSHINLYKYFFKYTLFFVFNLLIYNYKASLFQENPRCSC